MAEDGLDDKAGRVLRTMRMTAINRLLGRDVGSDQLIRLGLEAVLAGVEAPSLQLLAGLTRAEEPAAPELFDRVLAELALVPADLRVETTPRTWALVRWWAQLMVDGELDVHTAGELIYWHGQRLLEEPESEAFRALYAGVVRYDDTVTSWAAWDTGYRTRCRLAAADVLRRASRLLSGTQAR